MNFNLIGCGRLGKQLAFALICSGQGKLHSVYNKHYESAVNSVSLLGEGDAISELQALSRASLHFITTPDSVIPEIVQQLQHYEPILKGSTIIHCSGVLSSAILSPLRALGCHIACIHPLKPFPHQALNAEIFKDCYCSIEGDEKAVEIISPLFVNLGAKLFSIEASQKMLYHSAAAIASNYLVTIAHAAEQCMREAGVEKEIAKEIIVSLMQNSLFNVRNAKDLPHALTGPIARGDEETIRQHLQSMLDPVIESFYRKAGLATLAFAPLSEEKKKSLRSILED
ncbi:Rossmann-like and DUF2520 domain-containing protein [Legionella genomosp. 1]|uniref:Rossmann-like and DUF2520 domain-containing protein n=1 Tax=Legionella genomosp. 1 TaxID=1093625 RepID=UPI001054707F|nr:Rossmann-like and DUF2520 domain-containing protein [Legionella genomosp. 1]